MAASPPPDIGCRAWEQLLWLARVIGGLDQLCGRQKMHLEVLGYGMRAVSFCHLSFAPGYATLVLCVSMAAWAVSDQLKSPA